MYKIFRVDRSVSSHSPDPTNQRKFKLNGGGVLIAIKNTLNLNPKLITLTCSAEVLTVELSLPNKKKICVSTLYRVGTLGRDNFLCLQQYWGGGSNPIFAFLPMEKCVFSHFSPWGKMGKKSIWKEREKYSFPSLSIYFFPHFSPREKNGKTHIFPWAKMGLDPPPPQYYSSIFASKKYKHTYIIGDLNLEPVNWENNSSSDNTQSLFLDLFNNLGLTQLINSPTHRHGNILDIL